MERNDLDAGADGELRVQLHHDLNAQFPAVAARDLGLDRCRCCAHRRSRCPARSPRVIRVLLHYYAPAGHSRSTCTCARRGRCGPTSTRPSSLVSHGRSLPRQLARIPHYQAGPRAPMPPRRAATSRCWPPTSRPSRRCRRSSRPCATPPADVNRYPDPGARALRSALADALRLPDLGDRGRQRLLRDPARRGGGAARALERDRLRLASFSMYPHLAAGTDAKARRGTAHRRTTCTTSTRWRPPSTTTRGCC